MGHLKRGLHLVRLQRCATRNLLGCRSPALFLSQGVCQSGEALMSLSHMNRKPHDPGLIANRPADPLPDPGGGIRTEFKSLFRIKTLNGRSEERRVGKECRSRW